jgi:hypothetical protein
MILCGWGGCSHHVKANWLHKSTFGWSGHNCAGGCYSEATHVLKCNEDSPFWLCTSCDNCVQDFLNRYKRVSSVPTTVAFYDPGKHPLLNIRYWFSTEEVTLF